MGGRDGGLLSRKLINVDDVLIISKEANKIEDQPLYIADAQIFRNKSTDCYPSGNVMQKKQELIGKRSSGSRFGFEEWDDQYQDRRGKAALGNELD